MIAWAILALARSFSGGTVRRLDEAHARPPDLRRPVAFTLVVAAFLIVPAILSMVAGVTENYFRGIRPG